MIRPIRTIKKETRILGLDTCNPGLTVGVVARGGLYLDGIISFPPNLKDASGESDRRIVNSVYFSGLTSFCSSVPSAVPLFFPLSRRRKCSWHASNVDTPVAEVTR